ncbi:MAG: Yip1 family protein [Candidatus Melainabacteria bacterium]|jgi:hypothetical protein|nr:Yip1 family protein [Candidatus Melainabacteria bacterium]
MTDDSSLNEDSISPEKRISESNPRELELAFRQVLIQTPKAGDSSQSDPLVDAIPTEEETSEGKSKDIYKNGFTLWADIFYGVLVAPRQTMMILSDSSRFPSNFANFSSAAMLVVLTLSITAFLKIKPDNASASLLNSSLFIVSGLSYWVTLSCILYYLSIWLRGHRLTFGNAFIATGWAFLPFAFFAPIACMRHTPLFFLLATIPAFWFIALEWIAFQTSLRTSTIKLALILLVVPPVLALIYIFWIGLASFSLISQLLAAF